MKLKEVLKTKKGKLTAAGIGIAAVILIIVVLLLLLKGKSYRSISVEEVEGTVTVVGERNNGQAYKGQRLYSGDDISVMARSSLTMCMDNEKYVYAEENTHFVLEAETPKKYSRIRIILDNGSELNELTTKLGGGDSYSVETPNATMSVRGTVFRCTVYEGDDGYDYALLEVSEGRVHCSLKTGKGDYTGEEETFGAGESALIRGNDDMAEFVAGDDGKVVRILNYSVLPVPGVERLIALLERPASETDMPEGGDAAGTVSGDDITGEGTGAGGDTAGGSGDTAESRGSRGSHIKQTSPTPDPSLESDPRRKTPTNPDGTTVTPTPSPTRGAASLGGTAGGTDASGGATATPVPMATATPVPTAAPSPTTVPAATSTPTPVLTPTPAPALTPTPTPTPAPAATPSPTATDTPTPTVHVHIYGSWTVDADATCLKEGSRHRSCSCGDTQTESIAALGHDFSVEVRRIYMQDPTTFSPFYMVQYKCSRCEETEYRNEPFN